MGYLYEINKIRKSLEDLIEQNGRMPKRVIMDKTYFEELVLQHRQLLNTPTHEYNQLFGIDIEIVEDNPYVPTYKFEFSNGNEHTNYLISTVMSKYDCTAQEAANIVKKRLEERKANERN